MLESLNSETMVKNQNPTCRGRISAIEVVKRGCFGIKTHKKYILNISSFSKPRTIANSAPRAIRGNSPSRTNGISKANFPKETKTKAAKTTLAEGRTEYLGK